MAVILDQFEDIQDPFKVTKEPEQVWDEYGGEMVSREELNLRESLRADPNSPFYDANRFGRKTQAIVGPAGRTFEQVEGTDYLSPEEQVWWRNEQRRRRGEPMDFALNEQGQFNEVPGLGEINAFMLGLRDTVLEPINLWNRAANLQQEQALAQQQALTEAENIRAGQPEGADVTRVPWRPTFQDPMGPRPFQDVTRPGQLQMPEPRRPEEVMGQAWRPQSQGFIQGVLGPEIPFLRRIQEGAGDVGAAVGAQASRLPVVGPLLGAAEAGRKLLGRGPSNEQIGRFLGESAVPTHPTEIAAGLLTGFGVESGAIPTLMRRLPSAAAGTQEALERGAIRLARAYEQSAKSGLQTAGVGPTPKPRAVKAEIERVAELTPDHLNALNVYNWTRYRLVNSALRMSRTGEVHAFDKPLVQALDDAIQTGRLITDATVFRGLPARSNPYALAKIGDIVTDPAFMSTTTDRKAAAVFARTSTTGPVSEGTILEIRLPKGTAATDVIGVLHDPELLLERNKPFRVVSMRKTRSRTTVVLEPAPTAAPTRQPRGQRAGVSAKGAAAAEQPVSGQAAAVTTPAAPTEPPVGRVRGRQPPQPPQPPTRTGAVREPVFPRPSSLNPVSRLAFEASTTSDAFVESAVGKVSKLPVVHTAVDLVNPSALISAPPERLVAELGPEGAAKLQAGLLGHARRLDQASSLASAIEDGVRQRARAVGFKIEGARVVNIEGKPFVGDLFENPSKYPMPKAMREFVDDIRALLDDLNKVEKASGVKKGEVFSEEGRYFPRRVLSAGGVENLKPGVKRLTGAKQSFQKGRFYEYMEEGNKNGVNYLGDIAALVGIRTRAGLKAAADQEVAALVRPLGKTLKGGVGAKIGEMGTMVPAVGGRVFPQETAKKLIETLGTRYPGDIERVLNRANNILRPLEAIGDMGYTTLQAAATAFRNPVGFAKGTAIAFDALITDGRFYGRYLLNNREPLERFIAAGMKMRGNEMSFEAAAKGHILSKVFGKGPFGRLSAGFDNGINVMGLENAKAMAGISKALGPSKVTKALRFVLGDFKGATDDAVVAAVANKMTGRLSTQALGVSAAQRSIEGNLAFAANYYRAAFGLVGDAVQGGMRGAEGRRVLGGLVGGAVATHIITAKALGQDPNLDPTSSKFLTVEVGGSHVGLGGPIHGLIRTIAEAAENPDDLNDILSMKNPVTRWARGRLSPLLSLAVDIAAGSDYLGRPITTPGQIAGRVGIAASPFAAGTAIREGPAEALAQFFGLRAFPESPYEVRDTARDDVAQEKFGKPYRELFQNQRNEVDTDERVAGKVQKAKESNEGPIAQEQLQAAKDREGAQAMARTIDTKRAAHDITPEDARKAYDAEVQRLADAAAARRASPEYKAAIEEMNKSGRKLTYAEQAQEDYYSIFDRPGVKNRDGSLNFEAYDRELAAWEKKYPDVSKEQVSPGRPLSRGHAELMEARATLREYFDVRDEAWRQLSKGNTELSRYANLDDYRTSLVLELQRPPNQGGGGLSNAEAERLADKMVQKYSESASRLALNYLKAHPDLVPILDQWGYYVPADLRKLAVPAGSR